MLARIIFKIFHINFSLSVVKKRGMFEMKKFSLTLVLFSLFTLLNFFTQSCPSCSMGMYFTGKTKVEWGKLLKLYRCSAGHEYWVTGDSSSIGSSRQSRISSPTCPVCGMGTYWTGETRTEWGRLQKIYKCSAGHKSIGNF